MNSTIFKKGIALAAILSVGGVASVASAQSQSTTTVNTTAVGTTQSTAVPNFYIKVDRGGRAELDGIVASIATNSITVRTWSGVITVNISSATDIRRKYDARGNLSEFVVGDQVYVKGTVAGVSANVRPTTPPAPFAINAVHIKNDSIQMRDGTFVGIATSTTATGFNLQSQARGLQQVVYATSTKFFNRNTATTSAAIRNGTNVTVKGIWNRQATKITAWEVRLR